MSSSSTSSTNEFLQGWEEDLHPYACGECQGVFLVPSGKSSSTCPFCRQEGLMALGGEIFADQALYTQAPEGYLAPTLSQEQIINGLTKFQKGIPFHPKDLDIDELQRRLSLLYLPFWWVDVHVKGRWNAEMGFDYQVVSHQEYHNNGQWKTKEQLRTQTRWEERLGLLERSYQNTAAPALENWEEIKASIGSFAVQKARVFQPSILNGTAYQLPSIVPKDAWPSAEVHLHKIVATECQRACDAQHVRRFHLSPLYANHNWTQVLVPVYTTFYKDEFQESHPILIHGISGQLIGRERASAKKAKKIALQIGLIGMGVLAAALGLLFILEPITHEQSIQLVAFLAVGLLGLSLSRVPLAKAFNRKQPKKELWSL
ncbi:MAG: hypothetical protein AAF587_12215 [Bacteroidota bacterium]